MTVEKIALLSLHRDDLYTRCGVVLGGLDNENQTPVCTADTSGGGSGSTSIGLIVGVVAGVLVALAGTVKGN